MSPSLSDLLANPSVDHSGCPIPVDYQTLWKTKASSNTERLGRICQDDINFIHRELAHAAAKWEMQQGNTYYHGQFPVHHGDAGLHGAKVVPIKLNLDDHESINSFAGERALLNHDFVARRSSPMPSYVVPRDLIRWQICDSHQRPRQIFPARYLVWKGNDSEGALYARIPKPLEGLSRAASCDHCRIHDPALALQKVDYFDDRRHVKGIREMRAVDTAANPFSLCRFHWWYVWSGELLRRSHVHALEMLVGGELFERWGISHMREFLESVEGWCLFLEDSNELDPELARRYLPAGLLDDEGGEDDDDRIITNSRLPLGRTEAVTPQGAESPSPSIVPQETVASTVEQPLVPADQPAGTTTAHGSGDIRASYQSFADREADVLRHFMAREEPRLAELRVDPGMRTDPARREIFQIPTRAYNRRVAVMRSRIRAYRELASAQTSGEETIELAGQQTDTDPQATGDDHNPPGVTNSAPGPRDNSGASEQAETSLKNGQSTVHGDHAPTAGLGHKEQPALEGNCLAASNLATADTDQQSNGAPPPHATGLVASHSMVPVAKPQGNGTPAKTTNGLLYSPPTEPLAMRQKQPQQRG